jgi:hypothetical protein
MLPDYIQNACDWANMQGWKVFPANPNTKAPYISDPFGRATSNRDAIIELLPGGRLTADFDGRFLKCEIRSRHPQLELDMPETLIMPSRGYRIHELCAATGLGRTKIYELIGSQQLEVVHVGCCTIDTADSVRSLLQSQSGREG